MKYTAVEAELLVSADMSSKGYHISLPVCDAQPYDLIADNRDETIKIQVKLLYLTKRGTYVTGNTLKKYSEGDFHLLAVVFPHTKQIRYLDFSEIRNRSRLSFKSE